MCGIPCWMKLQHNMDSPMPFTAGRNAMSSKSGDPWMVGRMFLDGKTPA
jgi:hypothetical protein